MTINKNAKIFIAGHRGLVGSAILRRMEDKGYTNFILRNHSELDLTNQLDVAEFFKREKPEYVILAAAKVGGIVANNKYRAEFIYENLMIQTNIIHHSYLNNVKKLVFLGSTCIYPKNASQPMAEEELLTGELEYTNEPYAIAKIAGIKMCESYNIQYGTNFISVMPTNLYGPNDNFNLETSHVLPALVRKTHLAQCLHNEDWESIKKDLNCRSINKTNGQSSKEDILNELNTVGLKYSKSGISMSVWGTGNPRREFLWSEDMADATIFIMESINFLDIANVIDSESTNEIRNTHINIGTGIDISIKDLAYLVREEVGYQGEIVFDKTKLEGTVRKLTDVAKLHGLGWKHKVDIEEGIKNIYTWYKNSLETSTNVY